MAASKAAVRAARRAADKDGSLLQGIAEAETAGARAVAKLHGTIASIDLPCATGGSLRPEAYWLHREETEAAAALEAATAKAAWIMRRLEAAYAAREAARLASERDECRCDAYSSTDPTSPLYMLSEASMRRGEQALRSRRELMAAADAEYALCTEAINAHERVTELHVLVHGTRDVPPCASSPEQQVALLAEWSVEAIADRFGVEEFDLWWDAPSMIDGDDPYRQCGSSTRSIERWRSMGGG